MTMQSKVCERTEHTRKWLGEKDSGMRELAWVLDLKKSNEYS